MTKPSAVNLDGREFVILPRADYERLVKLARLAAMPPIPAADADGNYPAVEYVRSSIARDVVRQRVDRGLSQRELARLAGVRVETLCRIETGKHTASTATLAKLDRALGRAAVDVKPARKKPKRRQRAF
jgi:ribosome-binding protein aMBF1 (putative translation factor)